MANRKNKLREEVYEEIELSLGGGLVDVELSVKHMKFALDYALKVYRQKAQNGTIEKGVIFKYQKFVQEYDLSDSDIVHIRGIYRNRLGSSTAADYSMDPFMLMYTNQMMNALNQTSTYGSLSTIHLQYGYLNMLEQITAAKLQFVFNPSKQELTIFNKVARDEVLLIVADCFRDDDELLNDPYIRPWLVAYSMAKCKMILGEARGKFQTLAGPGGGVTLNGSELKQEAIAEIEKLEEELKNFTTADAGYGFYVG